MFSHGQAGTGQQLLEPPQIGAYLGLENHALGFPIAFLIVIINVKVRVEIFKRKGW